MKVAVYGTLRKDGTANNLIKKENGKYLGRFQSEPLYKMLDNNGNFPCLLKGGSTSITMEVYDLNMASIKVLDAYEGVDSGLYERSTIETPFGRAFCYFFTKDISNMNTVIEGDWIEYKKNKAVYELCNK